MAADGAYRPSKARERTNGRRCRSGRIRQHGEAVYAAVEALLRHEQWSPEQIAYWLAENKIASISRMTIYRHVRADSAHGGGLRDASRQGRKRRRKLTSGPEKRGGLQGKPLIDTRPPELELREEPGRWEGDTVSGPACELQCLLTLVERSSDLALVAPRLHRTSKAVNRATLRLIRESGLPFATITWDNGTEFHGYKALEEATGVRCYFAYQHRPWERGSNENFNSLIRQYFSKRSSLARLQQKAFDRVAHKLNSRPRKRYGFESPIE